MEKYVFITGATSGFGEACAEIFAKNGWNLILTGRRNDRLIHIQEKLSKMLPIDIRTLCFDVRIEEDVFKEIETLPNEIKENIHILINNAGLAVGRGPIDEGLIDDWDRMIDTNVKGLLYVTRAIVPFLKKNKKGHIFNLGSIAGKEVYAG